MCIYKIASVSLETRAIFYIYIYYEPRGLLFQPLG
nr:MAG TPA: hypothetical protein [Caudoviricetes sp.]